MHLTPHNIKLLRLLSTVLVSFGITEILNLNGLLSIIAGIVTAYTVSKINSKPAMKQADVAEQQLHLSISQAEKTEKDKEHEKEIAFWKERVRYNSRVAQYHLQVANIVRESKHNLQRELTKLFKKVQQYEDLLREKNLDFEPYEPPVLEELFSLEDAKIAVLKIPEPEPDNADK